MDNAIQCAVSLLEPSRMSLALNNPRTKNQVPVICSSVFLCISVPTDKDHDISAPSVQLHEKANVSFKERQYISHLYSDWYRPLLNSFAGSFPIGLCNRAAERYIKRAPGVVAAEMASPLPLRSE